MFYALSTYALTSAYGSDAVVVATNDPTNMLNDALKHFVSSSVSDITLVLIATSAGASLLSCHNVAARYVFNLAGDRALPPPHLGAVHARHGSPYRASIAFAAVIAVPLAPRCPRTPTSPG
ncbi:hypothetical protein [Streptomyces sp. NBC_01235]|uniref:hypothetical protein n=1 Tax=Streptomyces sp. NBC_01235 TaxID=2903788 RepID=UPI002E144682|nr:hypothetical protein OG289_09085 [Streptomyces sp. NBC_01235]